MSWPLGREPIVVVAHPDDEVIGAAVLLKRTPGAHVLHVTDGAPRRGRDALDAGFAGWADYGAARRAEAEAALALVGCTAERQHRLQVADQEASFQLAPLARRIAALLADRAFAGVITHAYEGGHPDHDATAFAVHAACRLLARQGLPPGRIPELAEMSLYHAAGGRFTALEFIALEGASPAVPIAPSEGEQDLKRRMVACHRSQAGVLVQFPVSRESFRRAPSYEFTRPPHDGKLFYEHFDWGMTGDRWRELARAALAELELQDDR
jgi:LmbE family N-acetylglucosaminyl deacetylase